MVDPDIHRMRVQMKKQLYEEVRKEVAEEMKMAYSPKKASKTPAHHHYRVTKGVQKFDCYQCDKIFSHRSALSRHKRAAHTANGAMRFQCPFCEYTGSRRDDVVYKHIRMRHPEKEEPRLAEIAEVAEKDLIISVQANDRKVLPLKKVSAISYWRILHISNVLWCHLSVTICLGIRVTPSV